MYVGGTRRWVPAPGIGIWDWNLYLWGFLKSFMLSPSSPLHCTNKVEWHVSRRRDGPLNLGNF